MDVVGGPKVFGSKPQGWADDPLAAFLDLTSENVLGSYAQVRAEYEMVREVDAAYVTFADRLVNPGDPIAPLFILQCHAAYRAAAGLAMSCQSSPAFMVMRGCLESSLYGLYMNQNPHSFEIWAQRDENTAARQRMKAEFTIRNVKDCLRGLDAPTHDAVEQMYEKIIDLGGHPNVAAMVGAFRATEHEDCRRFEILYLSTDSTTIRGTLKSVAQTGVCSLLIFRNAFPEPFDLLGITETLRDLRRRL